MNKIIMILLASLMGAQIANAHQMTNKTGYDVEIKTTSLFPCGSTQTAILGADADVDSKIGNCKISKIEATVFITDAKRRNILDKKAAKSWTGIGAQTDAFVVAEIKDPQSGVKSYEVVKK